MKKLLRTRIYTITLLLLISSCQRPQLDLLPGNVPILPETKLTLIPLPDILAQPAAEISGLAWFGDLLILLPQYPGFLTGDDDDGQLFTLPKQEIIDVLEGRRTEPPVQQTIQFNAPGLAQSIPGFEGYEAISFVGDTVFLTIETRIGSDTKGYLVRGTMSDDRTIITIETTPPALLDTQVALRNMSYESLFVAGEDVVALYEVNGETINSAPVASRFSLDLQPLPTLSFPFVDYRITDATALDSDNRFWAINYFTPVDAFLERENEPLTLQYGLGITHRRRNHVERLVEFQYSASGITRIDQAPLYLGLSAIQHNWEGLVRLDERGFLLVTDKFPGTVLGFVEG